MQLCSFPSRILSPPLSLLFSKQFFSSKSFFPTEPVFLPLSSAFPLKTRTRMERMQMNPQSGRLSSTQTQSFGSIYTLKAQFRSLRSLTYPEDAEDATSEPERRRQSQSLLTPLLCPAAPPRHSDRVHLHPPRHSDRVHLHPGTSDTTFCSHGLLQVPHPWRSPPCTTLRTPRDSPAEQTVCF